MLPNRWMRKSGRSNPFVRGGGEIRPTVVCTRALRRLKVARPPKPPSADRKARLDSAKGSPECDGSGTTTGAILPSRRAAGGPGSHRLSNTEVPRRPQAPDTQCPGAGDAPQTSQGGGPKLLRAFAPWRPSRRSLPENLRQPVRANTGNPPQSPPNSRRNSG